MASSAFTGASPLVDEHSRARVCNIDLPNDRLEPGCTVEVDCWVRGGPLPGVQTIDTLMYFDVAGDTALRYLMCFYRLFLFVFLLRIPLWPACALFFCRSCICIVFISMEN